jgi:hypothetical protein
MANGEVIRADSKVPSGGPSSFSASDAERAGTDGETWRWTSGTSTKAGPNVGSPWTTCSERAVGLRNSWITPLGRVAAAPYGSSCLKGQRDRKRRLRCLHWSWRLRTRGFFRRFAARRRRCAPVRYKGFGTRLAATAAMTRARLSARGSTASTMSGANGHATHSSRRRVTVSQLGSPIAYVRRRSARR